MTAPPVHVKNSATDNKPPSNNELPAANDLTPDSPASAVLLAHLTEQVRAMTSREQQARLDEPDGVHKMRVATRRLRSALATFRPLLDRAVTDPLRDELKWIAGELGGARDAEVLRMRLLDELAAEPDELVLGPIASLIEVELRADHRKAHDELVVALDSERYRLLVEQLEALIADPPFTDLASRATVSHTGGRGRTSPASGSARPTSRPGPRSAGRSAAATCSVQTSPPARAATRTPDTRGTPAGTPACRCGESPRP